MPPPKTIIVNREAILIGVYHQVEDSLHCVDRTRELLGDTWRPQCGSGFQPWWTAQSTLATLRENLATGWVSYDMPAILGRELTASERTRHNQAVREMEAEGLLEVYGKKITEIRLTVDGMERVMQQLQEVDGAPDNESSRKGASTPDRL